MWSGGKDSALALRRATAAGLAVTRLINFYDAATGRVRFHATRADLLWRVGRRAEAGIEFQRAAETAQTEAEREFFRLGGRWGARSP